MQEEKDNLPAVPEEDLGLGFEEMEGQDYSFPFLVICQANSPYLNPQHPLYIPEAKQSMIINTMDDSIYSEVHVIPCRYTFRYIEWKPRAMGGGFVQSYHRDECPNDCIVDAITGKTIRKNGNEIAATAYYLCMLQEMDFEKIIIPMASTQLKKSRKWNSVMGAIKQDGKPQPMFSRVYKLSIISESNSKGNWYGWKSPEIVGTTLEISSNLYQAAKAITTQPGSFLPEQLVKTIAEKSVTGEEIL